VVEAQRMPDALLALGALPSDARVLPPDAPVEAIQQRVEALFKKRLSVDLEKEGYETFRKFLLALLHGEDPAAGRTLAPEIEKQLALAREQFRALATGLLYLADGDSAVLERKADEGAEWLIAKLKGALDAE